MQRSWSSPGPKTDFFPQEIDALKAYLAKNGKLLLLLDPPSRADSPPLTNLIALAHDWGIDVGNDVVVDVSGMGQLFGASEAVPVAAQLSAASDHRPLPRDDGLSAVAIRDAGRGRRQRTHGATAGQHQRTEAGPKRTFKDC